MNRPYRGKTKEGKWMYGWLFSPYNAGWKTYIVVGHLEHGKPTYTLTEVIPETVGQQVGFPDKNGVEIHAGDKLDVLPNGKREYIRTVVWNEDYAQFEALFPDGSGQLFTKRECRTFEIIGDIHDNLEMLK